MPRQCNRLCLPVDVVASSAEPLPPVSRWYACGATEMLTPPSALAPPAGCKAPTPACTGTAADAAALDSASNTSIRSKTMVSAHSIFNLPKLKHDWLAIYVSLERRGDSCSTCTWSKADYSIMHVIVSCLEIKPACRL